MPPIMSARPARAASPRWRRRPSRSISPRRPSAHHGRRGSWLSASVTAAEGGDWNVKEGMYHLHEQEMVLPAWAAKPLRNMLSSGAVEAIPGSPLAAHRDPTRSALSQENNFHYSPTLNGAPSMGEMLRKGGGNSGAGWKTKRATARLRCRRAERWPTVSIEGFDWLPSNFDSLSDRKSSGSSARTECSPTAISNPSSRFPAHRALRLRQGALYFNATNGSAFDPRMAAGSSPWTTPPRPMRASSASLASSPAPPIWKTARPPLASPMA
jgi:hypothetical protein